MMNNTVRELANLYKQLHKMGVVESWRYHSNLIGMPYIEIKFKDKCYIQVNLIDEVQLGNKRMNINEAIDFLSLYVTKNL